jgi:thermostable 8-oxoguanine DNA glycosylase
MKKEYGDIKELIKRRLLTAGRLPTQNLIDELGEVKKRGYLSRGEFLKICEWKSPRPRRFYQSNSALSIRTISEKAFKTDDESEKMELLVKLKGVKVTVASALLTLTDPANYGLLDIRVWQLLHLYEVVSGNPSGRGFTCRNWCDYLTGIRSLAREFDVDVHKIDMLLFDHHKEIQVGNLY